LNRTILIQKIAADDDRLRTDASIAAAGDLTLLLTTLDTNKIGRKLIITSAGDDRTIYFIIDYLDAGGAQYQEVLFGVNAGIATSVNYMKTIVNIYASGASAGNVKIGTAATDGYVSPVDPIFSPRKPINIGIQAHLVGNMVSLYNNDVYVCLVSNTAGVTTHPESKLGNYYWKYLGVHIGIPAWVSGASYVSTNSGITYKVQYTLDDIAYGGDFVWFDSAEGTKTTDYYFNFGFPVTAVRILATVITTGGIIVNVEQTV
jgi:hypothetical protein